MFFLERLVGNIVVQLMYLLTMLIPVNQDKVLYISYVSNKPPESMRSLSKQLKLIDSSIKDKFICMKFTNTFSNKIKYLLQMFSQGYHIRTAKIIVIDGNNFVVSSMPRKDDTYVIQLWHAAGAIKKFGYDYSRRYEIKNYDFIINASSTNVKDIASAFRVKKHQVKSLGYIESDTLYNTELLKDYAFEMKNKYPQIVGKKVILYAPTFRGEAVFEKKMIDINLNTFQQLMGDNHVILYKLHPILSNLKLEENDNVINVNNENLYKLFSISDILVTDFSSIVYDFSILEKPMAFYTPDLYEYKKSRGIYVDYDEYVPGPICFTEEDLAIRLQLIEDNYDEYVSKVHIFHHFFFDFTDGRSAVRVANFIYELMN